MKFGLLYDLRNPKRWFQPFPQFYAETLDHMQAMDELGFDSLNITEHHFDEDGYCPSPIAWNAAMAARTKRALLGQSVTLLPFVHPVKMAEDVATVDLLSNGRAWLELGAGYRPSEFAGFGIDAKRRFGYTAEGAQIIRKCFTEEEFSFEGRHFQLRNVRMTPKPVQRPHPPIFLSGAQPGGRPMVRAIEQGFHLCTIIHPVHPPDPGAWQRWHDGFVETAWRLGKDPAATQTSNVHVFYVTEDPERAWHKHREGLLHQFNSYRDHAAGTPLGDRPRLETPEQLPNWRRYFLTPEDAVTYLRQEYGKSRPTHLMTFAVRPGMTYAESAAYHRLFLEKVAPKLRDLD
jgi:alkanesulfonate monooxygenase SsuD/methylene tetrahydromethanopterin reductase-like flavin-dependent oxidoreductase (luciferase family)